jgi:hypothetical protein
MLIPDPGFLSIPDPGPKTETKEMGEKNLLSYPFCNHKHHKVENYFIFELAKKNIWANLQRFIELFTPKIVNKLSKILVLDLRSRISNTAI